MVVAGPPIVLPLAAPPMNTPLAALGRASDSLALRPMSLPATTLPVVPEKTMNTPLESLPEMTLPEPDTDPPMVLSLAPL